MPHSKRWSVEVEEFRGFGRSEFWPFRGRLKSLAVGEDFADVRRSLRECCPARSGVYGMIDSGGRLIYVGMSIALRKRLVTYFQGGAVDSQRMPDRRRHGSTGVGSRWPRAGFSAARAGIDSPASAAVQRERAAAGSAAGIHLHLARGCAARASGAPGAEGCALFVGAARDQLADQEALEVANRYFKLSDCPASVPMHFADQGSLFSLELRPECLRHEMGTCLGPCAGECTRTQYTAQLRAARAFLDGRNPAPLVQLERDLHDAAQLCQFERAASLRDRLERLQYLHDRLELLREPPLPARFVYPVNLGRRQVWYLLADGRVVGATPIPSSGDEADKCLRRLRRAYQVR